MAALDRYEVRYLLVGGVAVGLHAEPRFTKDLDVLVSCESPEHMRLYEALHEFGAPLHLVKAEDFLADDFIFHFGAPPWRIDILTGIPGVDFDAAYDDREMMELGGMMVSCISKHWLIQAKRASGRHQDLADVERLES